MAKEFDLIYFEASAKSGDGVNEVFEFIANKIHKKYDELDK